MAALRRSLPSWLIQISLHPICILLCMRRSLLVPFAPSDSMKTCFRVGFVAQGGFLLKVVLCLMKTITRVLASMRCTEALYFQFLGLVLMFMVGNGQAIDRSRDWASSRFGKVWAVESLPKESSVESSSAPSTVKSSSAMSVCKTSVEHLCPEAAL